MELRNMAHNKFEISDNVFDREYYKLLNCEPVSENNRKPILPEI